MQQGVHNIHGVLAFGEPAVVFLKDAGNAVGGEPADGVFLRKSLQGALHYSFAAGIGFLQRTDAFEGIGEVAPAAAGNGHLREGLGTGFKHRHGKLRRQVSQPGGAEATGSAGSYDGDTFHCIL